MAETLFAFDEHNYRDCQSSFRGDKDQEYYLGDYSIEAGSIIDVRAERKAVGPNSIIRLKSRSRLSFRRSWAHIREDATDVTVLWFVKRGRLSVSNQCGSKVAEAGDFVVTRSMTPFFIECQTDEDQVHEVLHMTVPTHVLRGYISDEVATGFLVSTERREFAIAENILANLLEDDGEMAPDTAEILVSSALSVISHAIRDRNVCGRLRQTVSDRRLQEVLRYIEVHLSNPNLSTAMVASGCGISPRYLSFLLKHHGTSFSTLVWEQRLKKAKSWLSASSDVSISEIAYSVGFKSPAHFSRMFKRVFNTNPREFRAANPQEAGRRPEALAADNAN
jgi:AraC family transcriptional regulator, positive regulator of tynA and feaB